MRPLTEKETSLINSYIPKAVAETNIELKPLKPYMDDTDWKNAWNLRYTQAMNRHAADLGLRVNFNH